jgi:MrfA Zn-binding domain
MSKNTQRLSQLISTFGPGAMIDLPTRSVIVGGLELWDMAGNNAFALIAEQRVTGRLENYLRNQNRLSPGTRLTLRSPPNSTDSPGGVPRGITTPIFPTWFVCERVETMMADGKPVRRRRLVRWLDLDTRGRRRYTFDDGKKSDVIPIRFVCACKDGHLQDIDWRWVVHGTTACHEPMWTEEKGTSADPADTSIVCKCGRRLSLQETFQPGRLGACRGERPWLLDRAPEGCLHNLKLLTRTATNTYFPQVYSVISLPAEEDELSRLVDDLSADMHMVQSVADVAMAKHFVDKLRVSLGAYADADIFERLQRLRNRADVEAKHSPKLSEFDALASGRAEIGQNHPSAKLYAQTLPRAVWADPSDSRDMRAITNVVAVHRLREVSCLYGFTRFEAAPTSADGDIEDIRLAVRGAPLSQGAEWLPAIEQFGEGIFVHFDAAAINAWLQQPAVARRHDRLLQGYTQWQKRLAHSAPGYPGTAYVLLHSISHALMTEIALDCGYPATALKERVYSLPLGAAPGQIEQCGILIYTATAGAQGTLGGLVATTPRFAGILRRALDKLRICSNDPVCADHEPDDRSGDRATHGAACHGCLLVAETSCEMRNLFLDRTLLVTTMAGERAGFFG